MRSGFFPTSILGQLNPSSAHSLVKRACLLVYESLQGSSLGEPSQCLTMPGLLKHTHLHKTCSLVGSGFSPLPYWDRSNPSNAHSVFSELGLVL